MIDETESKSSEERIDELELALIDHKSKITDLLAIEIKRSQDLETLNELFGNLMLGFSEMGVILEILVKSLIFDDETDDASKKENFIQTLNERRLEIYKTLNDAAKSAD